MGWIVAHLRMGAAAPPRPGRTTFVMDKHWPVSTVPRIFCSAFIFVLNTAKKALPLAGLFADNLFIASPHKAAS
jgi:hypothetical protein